MPEEINQPEMESPEGASPEEASEQEGSLAQEKGNEAGSAAETQADARVEVENVSEEPTPAERVASAAREQAEEAAEALRRGEFMRDVEIDPNADSDDRLIAMLCYASQILIPGIMPILVLLSESSRDRPFQRYHAVQSLALMVVFVLIALAVSVGTFILSWIPIIGWLVGLAVLCLSPIAVLMAYIALVYYGYQAYQGKRFAIPGLTTFLKDQGWLKEA